MLRRTSFAARILSSRFCRSSTIASSSSALTSSASASISHYHSSSFIASSSNSSEESSGSGVVLPPPPPIIKPGAPVHDSVSTSTARIEKEVRDQAKQTSESSSAAASTPAAAAAAACSTSSASSSSFTSFSATTVCPPSSSFFESTLCDFQVNYDNFLSGRPLTLPNIRRSEVHEDEVFANADLPLSRISAYGYDYDFTLATYNTSMWISIFKYAQDYLVSRMGYPKEILQHQFDTEFAIRGLHFDTRTGYILKLDQNGKVQTATVYRGRERVELAAIVEAYNGISLPLDYRTKYLKQLVDLFALSETNLIADITQTFIDLKLQHSPDYIYRDVRRAIEHVHASGILHNSISANPEVYLEKNQRLGEYLLKLRNAGKMTFLLTNSPFSFVDKGMQFMLTDIGKLEGASRLGISDASKWKELFDVIICSARKPAFFTREGNFRRIDPATSALSWQPVREFRRGEVYTEGSLAEFTRLTTMHSNSTYQGHNVLYSGDHVGADLTGPNNAKWRTVAILPELTHEIQVQNSEEFKQRLKRLLRIEALIAYGQRLKDDEETMKKMQLLKHERQEIKRMLLTMFNGSFGSVFRTSLHRTEFFSAVGQYADCYTSSVNNFMNYSLDHTFYAPRRFFPHEARHTVHNTQ